RRSSGPATTSSRPRGRRRTYRRVRCRCATPVEPADVPDGEVPDGEVPGTRKGASASAEAPFRRFRSRASVAARRPLLGGRRDGPLLAAPRIAQRAVEERPADDLAPAPVRGGLA